MLRSISPNLPPAADPSGQAALAEQIEAYFRKVDGAFSENTQRAVRADLALFATLCRERGLAALPAVVAAVAAFVEEIHGAATLLVRGGKTDPEGRGAMVDLARDTVALVREWRSRSGIDGGRLFRSLSKGGAPGPRSTPARSRASTRGWRAGPGCRRKWWTGCRDTARGWEPPRTWSRAASSCPRSCRPGAGRPR